MENISIVLSHPQGAGNIGSVSRVMMNTGFNDLKLVNPVDYKNNEAYAMACNSSELLLSAKVFDDLNDAVADSSLVVGVTRRRGKHREPLLTMTEAIAEVRARAINNSVAVVFGGEKHGLGNDEVERCDMLFEIPTHEDYPSLNLSHAVFAFCFGLFSAGLEGAEGNATEPTVEAAPSIEVEEMFLHMERAMRKLEYGDKGGVNLLRAIMRNARRLFGRTGLMSKEVAMLRGIFTQIEEKTDKE